MLNGVTLADRYRLDEKLGAGAMGEVWKGFDLRLKREVAVKVFPSHLDPEPHRLERFRVEAQICGVLQHVGIVVIHDADEDQGRLFFVMELLPGEDLAKVMSKARNGLPIERVITIGARLADALAAAHAKKIIHRDIKPANIMLLHGDRPKLCDFGIAKVLDPDQGKATGQVGTAAYMAPEQFDGQPDERSDIYSLGCVLYEMVTGDRPFLGNGWQLIFQHGSKTPEAPSVVRAEIPAELNDLVLQVLAKKPEDRPQTAMEVAARLKTMRTPPASKSKPSAGDESVRQPPPQRLLKSGVPERKHTDGDDIARKKIEAVLRKARIDVKVAGYTRAPGLTRFEIRLGPATPAAAVFALSEIFAAALNNAAVRLVELERSTSPLPGVAAVGVEVPHGLPDLISLGDLLRETPTGDALILGRDRDRNPAVLDLTQSPHFLIGGAVGEIDPLRTLIASALMRRSPRRLRLALLDSRRGGLSPFTELPHAVSQENPLAWAVAEVERRYADLSATHSRTTDQFNRKVREGRAPVPLVALGDAELVHPDVLVVVDELAEAMRSAPTEKAITELTREGRAAGVHVIVRTASPDEHVITGRVKAYITARLALRVSTAEQSMRVLDHMGAESLHPDEGMLVTSRNRMPYPVRLAAISNEEIAAIVSHWQG
ncbi:DNA translocase FtsK [Streptosporangium sp. NPDC002524]|uniref:DNA translocase FtsK n=1 Tax=Streptosporangium sp. NPDC002524 TaxID=3154537 RepID=UPI00333321F2